MTPPNDRLAEGFQRVYLGLEGTASPVRWHSMETVTVLDVDLTEDEIDELRHVLESYLSDLRMEIADTDSFDFREMLKRRKQVISKVLDALPAVAESTE